MERIKERRKILSFPLVFKYDFGYYIRQKSFLCIYYGKAFPMIADTWTVDLAKKEEIL